MTELTEPPGSDHLTVHDRAHFKLNLRVEDGVVLGADMNRDPERGYRLFEAYHRRAVWMTKQGYRELAGLDSAP